MKVDLSDKVVLVMGVANETGKAMVEKLVECGADVGMIGLDIDELIKIETEINAKSGGRVFAIQGDISSSDDLANAVWQTVEIFGTLHLAIKNTGIAEDFQTCLLALQKLSL